MVIACYVHPKPCYEVLEPGLDLLPKHLIPRNLPHFAIRFRSQPNSAAACFYLVSLASVILFPPIVFTLSISAPLSSSAWMSSPPPMLLPLTRTFGTVRLPVLFASAACNAGPSGWLSSSTTYGAGTIVYFSRSIFLALRE
jgi:hypothetical protein